MLTVVMSLLKYKSILCFLEKDVLKKKKMCFLMSSYFNLNNCRERAKTINSFLSNELEIKLALY